MSLRAYELSLQLENNKQPESPPRHVSGNFLKGPIPMNWLQGAAQLPGKTFHLGIAIWFRAGLVGSMTLKLSNSDILGLGVGRDAKYEGLERLRAAGLISISQKPGSSPTITILLGSNT